MGVDNVARCREEFFTAGTTRPDLRDEVASSWQRCSSWSILPESVTPPYQDDLNPETRLIRAAGPVLDGVAERLGSLGLSFLVSDVQGRIVDRRVQERSLWSRLDRFHISPGHLFAEDAVGTNGIGTAIELGRATRIDGHEHYWDVFVGFTCVASPIVDPSTCRPIGVLDVTCVADPENTLLDLIVEQTARAIEARLLEQHSATERALLDRFLSANRRTRSGLVVLGDRILMANPQASRMFNDMDHPLIWDHAARALSSSDPIESELELPDGRLIGTRTSALRDAGEVIGSLMEIRPIHQLTAPAERAKPPSTARPRPADLIGDDRAFLDAFATAHAAVTVQPVIISGEAGVGKSALARELIGPDAVVHDAGIAMVDGEEAWLARVTADLAARHKALLLRRLDLLSADGIRRLMPVLAASTGRTTRCVITYACGVWSTSTVLPELTAERVWLPPLRNRLADLPMLVAARIGEGRVDSEVIQLFRRLPWPGNIRELYTVLDLATQSVLKPSEQSAQTVTLGDIPARVRSAAPRRPLSRFEQAEIHAILDALAETAGNKRDAAALLGISRSTLYRKLQNTGIDLTNTVF